MKILISFIILAFGLGSAANYFEHKEENECKSKGGQLHRFFKDKPLCLKNNSIITKY